MVIRSNFNPHSNMEILSSLSSLKHLGFYFILKRHLMSLGPSAVDSSTSHVCSWGTIIRTIFLGRYISEHSGIP